MASQGDPQDHKQTTPEIIDPDQQSQLLTKSIYGMLQLPNLDGEQIVNLSGDCIVTGNSDYVAKYVLPRLVLDKFDEEKILSLTQQCIDNGAYSNVVEYVLPELVVNNFDQAKVLELTQKCIENYNLELIAKHVLPELIKNHFDKEQILNLTQQCIDADSSWYIAFQVLPELIKNNFDKELIHNLTQQCISADSSCSIAFQVLPELIENHFDKEKILNLTQQCINAENKWQVAVYILPKLVDEKFDEAKVLDLTKRCINAESSWYIAVDLLPKLIAHDYPIDRIIGIIQDINKKGLCTSLHNIPVKRKDNFWQHYCNLCTDKNNLITDLCTAFQLKSESALSQELKNVLDKFKGDLQSVNGQENSKVITPKILKKIVHNFLDEVLVSTSTEVITAIKESPGFFQMLELVGIDLGGLENYGINNIDTQAMLDELLQISPLHTQESGSTSRAFGQPMSIAQLMTTYVLLEDRRQEATTLQSAINQSINAINVQLKDNQPLKVIESFTYSSIAKFLHDQIQENNNLSAVDQQNVEKLKRDLQSLQSLFTAVQTPKKNSEGIPKTVQIVLEQVPKGSIMEAIAGAVANACYIGEPIPDNIDVITIAQGTPKDRTIKGNFLLIHAEDKITQSPVVIIRALNPREEFSRTTDQDQLVKAIVAQVQNQHPDKTVLIVCDSSGGAATNRPTTFEAIKKLYGESPVYDIEGIQDQIIFNGYGLDDDLRLCAQPEG